MAFIDTIKERAKADKKTIVLPESMDKRTYEAAENKMMKAFNMVVLGAYLKVRPILNSTDIVSALKKSLPERHHNLIPMNEKAILKGMDLIK